MRKETAAVSAVSDTLRSPQLVPTRLVAPSERAQIVIGEARPPSRLRTWSVLAAMFKYLTALLLLRVQGRLDGGE